MRERARCEQGRALAYLRANWRRAILPVAILVALATAFIVDLELSYHKDHPDRELGAGPDATTFISTLVALYAVFLSVYGVLLPLLLDREQRQDRWQRLAFVLIVLAVIADLYRIENSLGDLYQTTGRHLSSGRVDDAGYEFTHVWFVVNLAAILGAVIALALRRRAKGKGDAGSAGPLA
jgi:hypothetical protein